MLPTSECRDCDHCSYALQAGQYAETKRNHILHREIVRQKQGHFRPESPPTVTKELKPRPSPFRWVKTVSRLTRERQNLTGNNTVKTPEERVQTY